MAHFSLVSLPNSKQHPSTENSGWRKENSFLAVLFKGDEPLDELLNSKNRASLVRKNNISAEE